VSNQQSKWRDVDGTHHFSTHEQTACEELIIPCGEFGVLFVSAVLIVVVFLGGFSTSSTERNKSMGDGIAAFLSYGVSMAVEPASARSRGSKGSSAPHASQARGRKAHKYRHHNEVADQRDRQLVTVQTVDCFDLGKDEAMNRVKPRCEFVP